MNVEDPSAGVETGAVRESVDVETLPDGSVSIPILEEELVVAKRQVVRERILVRKRTETQEERIEEELAVERLDVEADEGVLQDDRDRERDVADAASASTTVRAVLTVDDLPTLRNIPVLSADGAELGRVGDAYYDEAGRDLRLVGVARDPIGFRRLLVPLDGAVLTDEGLRVRYTSDELERLDAAPEETLAEAREGVEPAEADVEVGDDKTLVRHEERLAIEKRVRELGAVRARKRIETRPAVEVVRRALEHFDEVERVPAEESDSGRIETLEDGTVSIPVVEERLVVTKRPVIRERVVIRKGAETDRYRIEARLRREEVVVEEAARDEE